jgi:Domain of unknown function (DUF4145)
MSKPPPEFTEKRTCGHCGVRSPMIIVAKFYEKLSDFIKNVGVFEYGERYELLKCQGCEKIELEAHSYHEGMDEPIFNFRTLYPEPIIIPKGLPNKVKEEYQNALKARHGNSNGYGVLLGRVLEAVFHDKKAKGKMIGEQLKDLAQRNVLPNETLAFAKQLNKLRVKGAHFSVGKLTPKDIPIMEKLTKVILEYVYVAPFIMKEAEKAVNKANGVRKISPKDLTIGNNTVLPAHLQNFLKIGNETVSPPGFIPLWKKRMTKK